MDIEQKRRPRAVALAVVVGLLLVVAGFVCHRHAERVEREQACRDMYGYTLRLDEQGYSGPVRDPQFIEDRGKCFG